MPDSPSFGIRPHNWLAAGKPFEEIVDWVVRAEAAGFDSVHAADRLLSRVPPVYESTMYEVTTALTTFARETETMELSPLVYNVPFRHPIRVAKIFGTMDVAAQGRMILAVGTGWNPHEFEVQDVPRTQRGLRLEEGVEIIKQLWTENHVDYDGRVFSFEDVSIEPKPVQEPHMPIWFGSFGPEIDEFTPVVERVLERIGRLGEGWVPLTYSTDAKRMMAAEEFASAWERIAEGARMHGRDPADIEIAYSHWTYIYEDEDAERQQCEDALEWWFDGTYEEAKETYLIGTPAEVADQLADVTSELPRVDRFIFTPFTYDHVQMDRLATEVVPRLEDRF